MVEERFNRALGMRLRAARRHRGLSLAEVEALSDHEFRASVLGAYERGDRALSVRRLVGLAAIYGVPAHSLIPEDADGALSANGATIDLDRIGDETEMVDRFLAAIHSMRRDEATELAIRESDLALLASLVSTVPQADIS